MEKHTKTTLNIPERSFIELKKAAAERKTTVTLLVQEAIRAYMGSAGATTSEQFLLPDGSFRGRLGCQPDVDLSDWSRMRESIYEGHGS